LSTYLEMQTRIADELARSDLSSQIALEIQSAIDHYKRQRFWFNEGSATAMTTGGVAGLAIAVPSDWIELDEMTITDAGYVHPMEKLAWRDFLRKGYLDTTTSSRPEHWSYFRDQFYLGPCPDTAYTLTLYYVKALTALSADSDTNAWTEEAEALIRSRATAAVQVRYLRDDAAIADQRFFMQSGQPFLNLFEQQAFDNLTMATHKRRKVGKLRTELGAAGGFNIYTG
jgi:hypothetical protein